MLVDPASHTVAGIIDWGDAALVDPAYDAFGVEQCQISYADKSLRTLPGCFPRDQRSNRRP